MKRTFAGLVILCCLAASGAAGAADKVKLTVWGRDLLDGQPDHAYVTALVKGFQAQNPDIQLEYIPLGDPGLMDKTKIAMANNTQPDVVQNWGGSVMGGYADAGRLLDVTGDLSGVASSSAAKAAMSWKGKTYGVAPFFAIAGIFANEGLFQASGLKVPTTVEELEATAEALKAKGIQPFACGAKDKWPPLAMYMYLVNRYGGDAFTRAQGRKLAFDADPFVKAAQKYQEWVKKGYFGSKPLGEAYGDAQQLMATGKAAMHVTGSWMAAQYSSKDFTDQTIGFYAFPELKGGVGKVTDVMGMTDIGWVVTSKAADRKAAAIRFVKYAMSQEAVAAEPGRVAAVPGVKPPSRLTGMASDVFGKAKTVQFWWDQDLPPTVTTPLNDTIQLFFIGDTDVKAALTKFEGLVTDNVGKVK
jgi:raffinose/stachyose/melibiose transport system substrate-binding protein